VAYTGGGIGVCVVCGKKFEKRAHNQIKCGNPRCISKTKQIVCNGCGKKTWVRNDSRGYCSRKCAFADHKSWINNEKKERDHWPEKICKVYFYKCGECKRYFTSKRKGRLYCGSDCQQKASYRAQRKRFGIKKRQRHCQQCGKSFETYIAKQCTCSKNCRRKYFKRIKSTVKLRRLYIRDGGRCQLCGRKLHINSCVPNKRAPTIDHIVPLSLGGKDTYRNTQLACFTCNSTKGNRTVEGGEQLRLFG
jgi:endogenous inhibitor of DNA gyrase (YacG/DUF329 family)